MHLASHPKTFGFLSEHIWLLGRMHPNRGSNSFIGGAKAFERQVRYTLCLTGTVPSRGVSQLELSVSRLRHQGPEWPPAVVSREKECWIEEEPCSLAMLSEYVNELKKCSQPTHNLLAAEAQPSVGAILNINNFSALCRLLQITAYVLKAVRLLRNAAMLQECSYAFTS